MSTDHILVTTNSNRLFTAEYRLAISQSWISCRWKNDVRGGGKVPLKVVGVGPKVPEVDEIID